MSEGREKKTSITPTTVPCMWMGTATAERKRKLAAAVKRHYKRIRSQQLPKKLF